METTVALWGRDHAELGQRMVLEVDPAAALGLTRGFLPKPYDYVDPNEDVVALVRGPRATALVIADGHNGREASEAATSLVLDRRGEDPPPADLTDDDVVSLFAAADEAAHRVTRRLGSPRSDSRTTLAVALLTGERLQWAGVGDSAVFAADATGCRELTVATLDFIGAGYRRSALARMLTSGSTSVLPGGRVVAVTDGFTNYAGAEGPAVAVRDALAGAAGPVVAVDALLDRARAGGAGDNVAAAVVVVEEQAADV